MREDLRKEIRDFAAAGVSEEPFAGTGNALWNNLKDLGTELWLDTGDMEAAEAEWGPAFTALTTNNTLLNKEVQKGIYDELITEAKKLVSDLPKADQIREIGFILNARHGLRLARRFGARVSVELHTDLSHDIEGIVSYGERFAEIEPDRFIVKVPLTPTGLIGARRLGDQGIRVNFTLGFSARQNVFAAEIARPNYVNVFLGRLNAFVADNELGSGENVGERAALASQAAVASVSEGRGEGVRQIAASMRNGRQVASLAGMDVFTMPTKVASEAREKLSPPLQSMREAEYPVSLYASVDPEEVRVERLWGVRAEEMQLAAALGERPPARGEDIVAACEGAGITDLFPRMSDDEVGRIASDGKIPDFSAWRERIREGSAAVDALMNLAGLASFAADQRQLDERIAGLLG
ncbi:MAG: transaldolase family protein [Spirochaetaceae bacterium]